MAKLLKKGKNQGKNKKYKISAIILSITIFILFVFLIINFADSFSTLEKRQIYAKIIVSDRYGLDLNGTALTFGMTRPGGSASREIKVENTYGRKIDVEIYVKGEMEKYISISDNDFILEKNEAKNVSFTASIPSGTLYGNYTGLVTIKIKK